MPRLQSRRVPTARPLPTRAAPTLKMTLPPSADTAPIPGLTRMPTSPLGLCSLETRPQRPSLVAMVCAPRVTPGEAPVLPLGLARRPARRTVATMGSSATTMPIRAPGITASLVVARTRPVARPAATASLVVTRARPVARTATTASLVVARPPQGPEAWQLASAAPRPAQPARTMASSMLRLAVPVVQETATASLQPTRPELTWAASAVLRTLGRAGLRRIPTVTSLETTSARERPTAGARQALCVCVKSPSCPRKAGIAGC
mmetsp:Transcript_22012/g.83753  ORF Transcript_22012/g.83753 Transcript_22012/m.83753 type:complete len:262 (+) Transcript_22012:863-1648(+)